MPFLKNIAARVMKWTFWGYLMRAYKFLRRWGVWIIVGVIVLGLAIRRGSVLRQLSRLRSQLTAKREELAQANTDAELAKHSAAYELHTARAGVLEGEIADIQVSINRAEVEHTNTLAAIDQAKTWAELEKLRQEINAQ